LSKEKPVNKQQSAGGQKGAKKRWSEVSPEERSSLMKAAAEARWGPEKKKVAPKNIFASGLAKLRWDKLTPEERKEELARVRKERGKPKGK
jgi:hypothetical protein